MKQNRGYWEGFNYIFLITNDVGLLFICLLSVKCLVSLYQVSIVCFFILILAVHFIFWMKATYQIYVL